jgi:FkbM family methyltransferase
MEEFTIKTDNFQRDFQEKTDSFQSEFKRIETEFKRVETDLEHLTNIVEYLNNRMDQVASSVTATADQLNAGSPWISADQRLRQNPEFLLLAHLVSYFDEPIALDVGANEGALIKVLLDAGFEVYAFEPYPPVAEKLRNKLGDNPRSHVLEIALGSQDKTLVLHIAEDGSEQTGEDPSVHNTFQPHFVAKDVSFNSELQVPVRSLSSLVAEKAVPSNFQVLKVDTEGFDLEVIRGLGQLRPAVLQTEFWGEGFLFVKQKEVAELALGREIIKEMRARGYRWNLIMFREEGVPTIRFTANLANVPNQSQGNIFFFRDYRLFEEAYRWSQGALPQFLHRSEPSSKVEPPIESSEVEAAGAKTPDAETSRAQGSAMNSTLREALSGLDSLVDHNGGDASPSKDAPMLRRPEGLG